MAQVPAGVRVLEEGLDRLRRPLDRAGVQHAVGAAGAAAGVDHGHGRPGWKGQVGIAPSGADFQAIVSAVVAVEGASKAQAWLKGLESNAKIYRNNVAILSAVNAGEIRTGIIYHYYWYQDQAESGANSKNVQLEFFGHKDPGAFLSTSGAGVLKSSKHPDDAQKLVNYLTGKQGQQALVDSNALEYPVGTGVAANPKLKPLSELDPPEGRHRPRSTARRWSR